MSRSCCLSAVIRVKTHRVHPPPPEGAFWIEILTPKAISLLQHAGLAGSPMMLDSGAFLDTWRSAVTTVLSVDMVRDSATKRALGTKPSTWAWSDWWEGLISSLWSWVSRWKMRHSVLPAWLSGDGGPELTQLGLDLGEEWSGTPSMSCLWLRLGPSIPENSGGFAGKEIAYPW